MMPRLLPWLLLIALSSVSAAFSLEPDLTAGDRRDLTAEDKRRVEDATRPATDFHTAEAFEIMQGGAATSIEDPDRDAFSRFSANLPPSEEMNFRLGNALFRKLWVASPSSTQASDGLGPFYNSRSCEACHIRDGRGHPPDIGGDATSMLLRLARGPQTDAEREALATFNALNFPDPTYGKQLQDKAIAGLKPEGLIEVSYQDVPFIYPDGTEVTLSKPLYRAQSLRYGPLDAATTASPRVAPAMIGMGLIEAISDTDLLVHVDPDDDNEDGISGRPQLIRDKSGMVRIGRFGWKGENFAIRDQSAQAFHSDIGISTSDMRDDWGDCTEKQADCRAMPSGSQERLGTGEAPDPILSLVTYYAQHLAVPARRKSGLPETLEGKALFYQTGCIACHVPKYVTRKDWPDKALSFQLIWPYSDFLLHDMGEDLADGQQVGQATGREWRTPPLWGIGLTRTVSGHTYFMHDGRARSFEEAILWHGGEAARSRHAFTQLAKQDRQRLLDFLESL